MLAAEGIVHPKRAARLPVEEGKGERFCSLGDEQSMYSRGSLIDRNWSQMHQSSIGTSPFPLSFLRSRR